MSRAVRNRASYRYRAKLRAQGRCVVCVKMNDRTPKLLCSRCADRTYGTRRARHAEDERERVQRLKEAGLCARCRQPGGTYLFCLSCRLEKSQRARVLKALRRAA